MKQLLHQIFHGCPKQLYYSLFCCIAALLMAGSLRGQTIRYVKEGATGNGSDWASASGNLQEMINASNYNDEIWVAAGRYQPAAPYNHFYILGNIKIYGGFPATGSPVMADRNYTTNLAVLQGNGTNSVVRNDYYAPSSAGVIDGFTIQGGGSSGGGIYNWGASPTISNCVIKNNYSPGAGKGGGGIYNTQGSIPTIINCTFDDNSSERGGAIYNNTNSGAIIKNCIFRNNRSTYSGGAIQNYYSTVTIQNSIFHNNNASSNGDAGAIANYNSSTLNIYNSLFYKNTAASTSAILNVSSSAFIIANCTFEGNYNLTSSSTPPIGNVSSSASNPSTISNSVFWNNGGGSFSGPYLTGSYNLITNDPEFVDAGNGNYQLQSTSPAINAGDNSLYDIGRMGNLDLAKNNRIAEGTIDMGAYEWQMPSLPVTLIFFQAEYVNRQAILRWQSGVESNVAKYEIEKSLNAQTFTKAGEATVEGSNKSYTYTIPQTEPTAYYRLKMVDKDGSHAYSEVRIATFSPGSQSLSLKVYPNPARSRMVATIESDRVCKITFYDITGRCCKSLDLHAGKNLVNLSDLPSGLYILHSSTGHVTKLTVNK